MPHAGLMTDDQTAKKKRGPEKKHEDAKDLRLRLPGALLKKVRAVAFIEDASINDLVIQALEQWWDGHPQRHVIEAKSSTPKPRRQ